MRTVEISDVVAAKAKTLCYCYLQKQTHELEEGEVSRGALGAPGSAVSRPRLLDLDKADSYILHRV